MITVKLTRIEAEYVLELLEAVPPESGTMAAIIAEDFRHFLGMRCDEAPNE